MNEHTLSIEVEQLLPAPVEAVWELISRFGIFRELVDVTGDVRVGETVILDFGSFGKGPALITRVVPNQAFAFRSYPGANDEIDVDPEQSTLTEILLTSEAGGTKVTVRESGFERIPNVNREIMSGQHEGWKHCMAYLSERFSEEESK